MNMVEIFFGIITRQAIRRGSFASVREITDTIGRFIDSWNEHCESFTWTEDADTIVAKANDQPRPKTARLPDTSRRSTSLKFLARHFCRIERVPLKVIGCRRLFDNLRRDCYPNSILIFKPHTVHIRAINRESFIAEQRLLSDLTVTSDR
jgi:hypothetical protein